MITDHSISTLVAKPVGTSDKAYTIELIAAVKEGLAELDRGEFFTLEEVEKEIPSWISKSLLFAAITMTAGSCLTQASPSQQSLVPLNISTYEQANPAPAETIQPLEITIDDLVNTPWDEASPKAHVPWYSYEDFNGAQILEPLSITLEKGQDLIIHISNSKDVEGGYLPQHGFYIDARELIYTINEIDWGRGHSLDADPYFPCRDEQGMLSYHVINSHSGKNDLTFKYCLSGSDRSGDSKVKVNVKKIFVTCE